VGLDGSVVASAGAYPALGPFLPTLTQLMAAASTTIPHVRFKTVAVATNNTTVGPIAERGVRSNATLERVVDVAAAQIGMDPAEIRRNQLHPTDQFPFTTPREPTTTAAITKRRSTRRWRIGIRRPPRRTGRRRATGMRCQLGIGLSTYVEVTAPAGLHIEFGAVEIHDDGSASVVAGTARTAKAT